jgi:TorA maturation chaperone TorD
MKIDKDQGNLLKGYNMLLYFSGSIILNEPTEECITDFWSAGRLVQLPVSSSNPRFLLAASLFRESCSDKVLCRKKLSEDYFRLFNNKGLMLAPPYKSRFIDYSMNTAEDVSEFYDIYEWKSGIRGTVPDDHLGIELLFLTYLIDRYLQLDDDPCIREMRKEIRRFIKDHILSWMPLWNDSVQEHSGSYCYKGIGNLIYASVEDLDKILSHP